MYAVDQCSDVFVDACIRNEASQLMFLSLYGRDTATKELLARMQLGKHQGGLQELQLKGVGDLVDQVHTVVVGDPDRLEKFSGRLPKGNLYGNLTHMWVYDPAIQTPNKGAKQAWVIDRQKEDLPSQVIQMRQRIWQAVTQLASIPLLPHWQEPVLQAIWTGMVTEFGKSGTGDFNPSFSAPLGCMVAYKVTLLDTFPEIVSTLIRDGTLTLQPIGLAELPPADKLVATA